MGGAVPRKIGGGAADVRRGVQLTERFKSCATDGAVKAVSAGRLDKQPAKRRLRTTSSLASRRVQRSATWVVAIVPPRWSISKP